MNTPIRLGNVKHINDDGIGLLWQNFPPGHISPIHSHTFYELELTLSGETTEYINGEPFLKKRGTVSILSPADFHSFEVNDSTDVADLMFEEKHLPSGMTSQVFSREISRSVILSEEKTTSLENLFRVIDSVKDYDKPLKSKLIKNLIESALLIIIKEYNSQGHKIKDKKQSDIEQMLQYIDLHFRDNPSVGTVAEAVGKSPDYFSKYFKKHVGCGYSEYLNKRKTECAEVLLRISDMSITEICFNSGFDSMSNFLRVFKLLTGSTPSDYRAKKQ